MEERAILSKIVLEIHDAYGVKGKKQVDDWHVANGVKCPPYKKELNGKGNIARRLTICFGKPISIVNVAVIGASYRNYGSVKSGNAGIWICRRQAIQETMVFSGVGFISAKVNTIRIYSCCTSPSATTV